MIPNSITFSNTSTSTVYDLNTSTSTVYDLNTSVDSVTQSLFETSYD